MESLGTLALGRGICTCSAMIFQASATSVCIPILCQIIAIIQRIHHLLDIKIDIVG